LPSRRWMSASAPLTMYTSECVGTLPLGRSTMTVYHVCHGEFTVCCISTPRSSDRVWCCMCTLCSLQASPVTPCWARQDW
jgi:hypothetical protein